MNQVFNSLQVDYWRVKIHQRGLPLVLEMGRGRVEEVEGGDAADRGGVVLEAAIRWAAKVKRSDVMYSLFC